MTHNGAAPRWRIDPLLSAFLALFLGLTLVRLALIIAHRVPMGHDTFHYLYLQYTFFNEAAHTGNLPYWMPFQTHGTVGSIYFLVSQGLLASILYLVAPALKGLNFLYLHHAGLLFDEFALLLGSLLLARRYYRTVAACVFVSAALVFSAVSATQIWWDFHLYYLLPLGLYCLHRALGEASAGYLFLGGLFGVATLLGNLPYFVPITLFTLFVFGVAHGVLMPRKTLVTLKQLRSRLSWRHGLALLLPLGFAAALAFYLTYSTDQLAYDAKSGRTETGGVASIDAFLTYGVLDIRRWLELIGRLPNHLDNTVYSGVLVIPFAFVALARVSSSASYAFGATALVLFLFSAGTWVSVAFFYFFPLGNYFRHIGLIGGLAAMFLVFYAGFGFDAFWLVARRAQAISWRNRTLMDKMTLLAPPAAVAALALAVIGERLAWYRVFIHLPSPSVLFLIGASLVRPLTPLLILYEVCLALLAAVVHWPGRVIPLSLLLMVHVLDVTSYRVEFEYLRVPQVTQEVIDLFEPHAYRFASQRSQDYASNDRYRALAPFIFSEWELTSKEAVDPSSGPYGARYSTAESFLFFDAGASVFRTDIALRSVDSFYGVWVPAPSRPPYLFFGPEIPASLAYRKLSGFESPKLQVFSKLHVLPSDNDVAEVLRGPAFAGDLLLISETDIPSRQIMEPTVRGTKDALSLAANERVPNARIDVQDFSFNTLRVRIDTGSSASAILYYADAWHPHWHAYVNGTPTPVLKTNLGYKSVVIPGGVSEIEFAFGNAAYQILSTMSVLLGALAAIATVYLLRDIRWQMVPPKPA